MRKSYLWLCVSTPPSYLAFRLLGSALPLLSLSQIKVVLSGDVMRHYGEHVVSAQVRSQRIAPEYMMLVIHDLLNECS